MGGEPSVIVADTSFFVGLARREPWAAAIRAASWFDQAGLVIPPAVRNEHSYHRRRARENPENSLYCEEFHLFELQAVRGEYSPQQMRGVIRASTAAYLEAQWLRQPTRADLEVIASSVSAAKRGEQVFVAARDWDITFAIDRYVRKYGLPIEVARNTEQCAPFHRQYVLDSVVGDLQMLWSAQRPTLRELVHSGSGWSASVVYAARDGGAGIPVLRDGVAVNNGSFARFDGRTLSIHGKGESWETVGIETMRRQDWDVYHSIRLRLANERS